MHQSKGCPNHLSFFFGCCSFTAPEWLLLSPLPLHSFDWQMGGKDGGWRVGGRAIMGLCVTVRACLQRYLSSQQMRWERQVRRGRALFKSLFTVPAEPLLAFPNGASQARHPVLLLVIPVSSVLVARHCFNSLSHWQYRHYNTNSIQMEYSAAL